MQNKTLLDRIGIGTVQFGLDYGISNKQGQVEESAAHQILDLAIDQGATILDTSCAYGESEEVLGRYEQLKDFNVVSKWHSQFAHTPRESIVDSLKKLRLEKCYGYLVHNPGDILKDNSIWGQMEQLKSRGLTKKIGVSVYSPAELVAILEAGCAVDIVQIPFNWFDHRFEPMLPELKKMGIEIHTRSVFLQGLFWKPPSTLGSHFDSIKIYLEKLGHMSKDSKLRIALLLQEVLKFEEIDNVIVGFTERNQLSELICALELDIEINLPGIDVDDENILNPALWPT